MRIRRPEPHTLAGAYALDALDGADEARFERHQHRCRQCAEEIRGLREATARLAAATAADSPAVLIQRAVRAAAQTRQLASLMLSSRRPLRARHAAAATLFGRAMGTGAAARARARTTKLALTLAAAGVAVAAILALAARSAQDQVQQDQQHSHAIVAVLTARDAAITRAPVSTGGTATIVMSEREHALVFAAKGLPALPATRRYELWLMSPSGDKPAGMLPVPRRGMTGPVLASGLGTGDRLGLTIEPAAGSPHPTTGAILLLAL
jgi:anti-sigma-K factor RskA